jgi:beta-glucosidase
VVVVGQTSGEGADRPSLALAGDQDMLVSAVAAANPRTIVVLNTPGAVLMPWLGDVAAVLQAWYPGETFGEALAAVLFGDAEPGGRLPATFPASDDQGPTRARTGTRASTASRGTTRASRWGTAGSTRTARSRCSPSGTG